MKKFLFILVAFVSFSSYAQLSDLHYLPPLKQGQNNKSIQSQAVYLSTPETSAFTVNAYQGTNPTPVATFNISNVASTEWFLANGDNNISLVDNANTGTVLTNSGLRFEAPSGNEFYVNYRGNSGSQAASLTSKGRKAIGTNFKWGGVPNLTSGETISNTLGIMATEDGTTVTLSDYDSDCVFRLGTNTAGITDDTYTITLDANESFVFEAYVGIAPTIAQQSGWLGASIESNKNIVISNGSMNFGRVPGSGVDAGIDQPVPENNIGNEYVFVRGNGVTSTEFPLIIATADNTNITVNGGTTPIATIDKGEFFEVPSSYYSTTAAGGNMFVTTNFNVYAYQCLAGNGNVRTVSLNFVAPVNCLLPDYLDNIPDIRNIAGTNLTGGLTIIAAQNTPDANIKVTDGSGLVSLPASSPAAGSEWKTFFIPNLSGDVSVASTGPMAIGFFGYSGAKGVAGYFSGFDTVPSVDLDVTGIDGCFPGSSIFEATANFDAYQWYDENGPLLGENGASFAATQAGTYYVNATKGPCSYNSLPFSLYNCNPDIIVNKSVDKPEITEGETATFTIRVESSYVMDVTNLQITDNIPAGLTLINAHTTTGTWNGSVWNIGTLEPGEVVFLELEVQGDEIGVEQFIIYTNTASNTQDQTDANITEDIMSSRVKVNNDFDNDGVIDSVDLDDDNDGLYDTDECSEFFCFDPIINESFEDPIVSGSERFNENLLPGWFTTAVDQQVEVWRSGFRGVNSYDGNQHAELNANTTGALYQNLCLTPGTEMNWSLRHRGRDGDDTMQLRIGADIASATIQQTMISGKNAWVLYSGTYTVPAGQTNTVFLFEAVATASGRLGIGNFIDDIQVNVAVPEGCVDTDLDGIPNNLDLDSDNDGCSDADEFYSDNNADGNDDGYYGVGVPVVDATDGTVIGAPYVQAFAPSIVLENTTEDLGGTDITDSDISLGDTFDYVIRFQNQGQDAVTGYTIRDVLPSSVDFVNTDLTGAPGATASHDPIANTVTFEIPDNLVEIGDPQYSIRITVELSNTCSDFVNACSEIVESIAYSTYQGVTNTNTFSDEPGSTVVPVCGVVTDNTATNNVLNDLLNCNIPRTVQLCGADVTLTAGTGFANYTWAVDANGNGQIDPSEPAIADGASNTLLVTEIGEYIVEKSGAPTGCSDLVELITVELFGATQNNPITDFFNRVNSDANPNNDLQGTIAVCAIDGSELPQIFLCGDGDDATIQTGITDADTIVWQLLDEASCDDVGEECRHSDFACGWTDVATGADYTITASGKYRIVINYANGCVSRFYFNVYKNTLALEYISSDIICTTEGNIRITNIGSDYGFQLVDVTANNVVVDFAADNGPSFDITASGTYKVQVTPLDPTTGDAIEGACVFETEDIGILEPTYEVVLDSTPADCSGFGTIAIQALNVLPNYSYELRFEDGTAEGTFFQESVANTDNTHTFTSVPPGDYIVNTTTDDGCADKQLITVDEIPDLTLAANTSADITCNAGLVTLTPGGGDPDPNYNLAIWSYNGIENYADVTAIPNADFQNNVDFLFPNSTDAGDYVFVVVDSNGCFEFSNQVTVNDLGTVEVTASNTPVTCADSSTATITVMASRGTPPYEYSLDGTNYQSVNTFTNVAAGSYTITVRDNSGTATSRCIESIPYEIVEPFRLTASAAVVEDTSCDTTGMGTLVKILNASGGQMPYEYSFDSGTSFSGLNEMRLVSGTYQLVLRDALGCTLEMDLNVPSAIAEPGLTPTVTYECNGDGIITVTSDNTTDYDYTYALNTVANTPADNNIFTGVAAGTHTVTVDYTSTSAPTQNTFISEDFGAGVTTEINEIGPGYCYEPQDGSTTDCNLGPAGIFVNGEYAVTNAVNNPVSTWRSPNDHTGITDGRFLAIGVSNTHAGADNVLWQRTGLEVLTNQEITVSFYAYNLLTTGSSGNNPQVLVQLVDAGGTVLEAIATSEVPKNNDADDWHLREVTFNAVANTAVGIVLRTNLNSDDGNLLVMDDITATQIPESCASNSQDFSVVVETGKAFEGNFLSVIEPTCNGDSDGAIRFEVANFDATAGYEYSLDGGTTWTASTTSPETTPATLATGTYTIDIRKLDDITCTTDFTTTLTEPAALVPDLTLTEDYSCLAGGATLTASATGGTVPYDYQLEDAAAAVVVAYQTDAVFTAVPPGDYLVRVRDDKGCEQVSLTPVTVTETLVEFDATFTNCYDGLNNASITATVSSGSGGYTFRINGGAWLTPTPATATDYTFSGLANGSYDIEVADSVGCEAVLQTIVIAPVLVVDVDVVNVTSCADGNITVNATGGTPVLVYAFVATGTAVQDSDFSATSSLMITSATVGDYDVYVRDNNGTSPTCEYTETVTVAVAPALTYTTTANDPECRDENGDIAVSITSGDAPYTFELIDVDNSGASSQTISNVINPSADFFNLMPGEYTLNVTDTYGCVVTQNTTVTNPDELTAMAVGKTPADCDDPNEFGFDFVGYPTTLGPIEFSADGGATWQASPEFGGLIPGETVFPSLRTVDAGGSTICETDLAQLIIPQALDDLSISVSALLVNCNELQVTVQGSQGTPNYEYTYDEGQGNFDQTNPAHPWTSPATDASTPYVFTGLIPGRTYTFYVRDAVGCTRASSVNVNDLITIPLEITASVTPSCNGIANGSLEYTIVENTSSPGTEMEWILYDIATGTPTVVADSGGNVPFASPLVINSLSEGNYYIEITKKDGATASCISASENDILLELDAITGTPTAFRDIGCNRPGLIDIQDIDGGGGIYNYTVTGPAPFVTISGTTDNPIEIAANSPAGTYNVQVVDQFGCPQNLGDVTLALSANPTIDTIEVDNCASQATITVTPIGGVAPILYSIDGGTTYASNGGVFTNVAPGSYTINIIDSNGCTDSDTVVVNDPLQASASLSKVLGCGAGNEAEIVIDVSSGSGNYEYDIEGAMVGVLVTDGALTTLPFRIAITQADIYTITVSDLGAAVPCERTFTIEVDPAIVPVFTPTPEPVSCALAADGYIVISETNNGINPLSYSLSPGTHTFDSTTNRFENLAGGTYEVTALGANGCSTVIGSIVVDEPNAIVVDLAITPFGCTANNDTNNAEVAVATVMGGSSTYVRYRFIDVASGTILQDGPSDTFIYTDFAGGDVRVIVTDNAGCTGDDTDTVVPFDELQNTAVNLVTAISCANAGETVSIDATGAITNAMANAANYEFRMLPSMAYQTSSVFPDLAVGTYTFGVRNISTGCELITDAYVVSDPNTFVLDVELVADTVCPGDLGTFRINMTDSTYMGVYRYEVFETNGTVDVADDTTTGIVGVTTATTPNFDLPGGQYRAVVMQDNLPSCMKDEVFTIATAPDPIILDPITTSNVGCSNNQGTAIVTPMGGTAPYMIALTNMTTATTTTVSAVNAHIFQDLVAATYTIVVTDALGCTQDFVNAFTLEVPDPIVATISITKELECQGDTDAEVTVTLDPRTSPTPAPSYNYSLNTYADATGVAPIRTSTLQTTPDFDDLVAGFYSITVTDDIGCSDESAIIEIVDPIEVNALLRIENTLGCTTGAELLLIASGGTAPYQWSEDGTAFAAMNGTAGADTHLFANVPVGSYTYYIRDSNMCTSIISNEIVIDDIIPLTATLDTSAANISCNGEATGVIIADADGDFGNYEYALFDAAMNTEVRPNQTSGVFADLPEGRYYVRVQSRDCEYISEEVPIVAPPAIDVVETISQITCADETDGSITIDASGGTEVFQYAISPNLSQFFEEDTFDELSPGDYIVIVQDSNGCSEVIEFTLVAPTELTVTSTTLNETCFESQDGSISLEIEGGTAPYFTSLNSTDDADFMQDRLEYTDLSGGFYEVYVRDANGCELNSIVEVESGPNLAGESVVQYFCDADVPVSSVSIVLEDETVLEDVLYALDADEMGTASTFNNLAPGDHSITVAHSGGCDRIFEFTISDFSRLELQLMQTDINTFTATATGGAEDYTFTLEGESPTSNNEFYITRTDTYTVVVTDQNGCSATAQIDMVFIDVEFPNFFTPDGDGFNDTWAPINVDQFPNMFLKIYDRYGRSLYTFKGNNDAWDGYYNLEELPSGDYWYIIKLNGAADDREFVGHFSLYR